MRTDAPRRDVANVLNEEARDARAFLLSNAIDSAFPSPLVGGSPTGVRRVNFQKGDGGIKPN